MDLNKNKYGIAFLVIVAVAAIHYFFFYNPCKEPQDLQVAMAALQCAQETLEKPADLLRAELCSYVKKGPDCEFSEEDKYVAIEMLNKQIYACTKEKLKAENLCVDKVDVMMKAKGL